MLGNIYLTRMKLKDRPELLKRLSQVEKVGYDAANMISKLLTFARKGEVDMVALPLTSFVKESYKLNRLSIPENIHMQLNSCTEEMHILGDATQLQQLLLNLLTNARHAVESVEDASIVISLDSVENSGEFHQSHIDLHASHYACLSVTDNGYGIPLDLHDHIFEPFYTTKEAGKGTGLGLAMVFGVAESHGGVIELESDIGKGASFHIYLPLIEEKSCNHTLSEASSLPGLNETILLADDEESVRTISDEILSHLGYRVLHARNGRECVDMFERFQDVISLVITDVVMPEMSGTDAARLIRQRVPNMPIVFITGYDRQSLSNLNDFKQSRILNKPAAIPELSAAIRELLDKQKQLGV